MTESFEQMLGIRAVSFGLVCYREFRQMGGFGGMLENDPTALGVIDSSCTVDMRC